MIFPLTTEKKNTSSLCTIRDKTLDPHCANLSSVLSKLSLKHQPDSPQVSQPKQVIQIQCTIPMPISCLSCSPCQRMAPVAPRHPSW